MKKMLFTLLAAVALLAGCTNADKGPTVTAEDDIDAAREFVRASLDGNFDRARQFMVQDSAGIQLMDNVERRYKEHSSPEEKQQYHNAEIKIFQVQHLDSLTSSIAYFNTYTNKKDTLRVIKEGEKWLVDFKYLLKPQTDSLP